MSWICSDCGTENPNSATVCMECERSRKGQSLEDGVSLSETHEYENRKTKVRVAGMDLSESAPTRVGVANGKTFESRKTVIRKVATRLQSRREENVVHHPTVRGGIGFHAFVEPFKPKCSLTLIPEESEDVEALKQNYEGESIILNRNNTEPTNRTITSREQAVLTFKDGGWYIENRSELESTFIKVTGQRVLQPGDVIALGDRRFKFEVET